MDITNYCDEHFDGIFNVVHKTIEEVYPRYYPKSTVEFFHEHHSKENMKEQLPNEFTLVAIEDNKIVGTGALFENVIRRFFILPEYRDKGVGNALLKELKKNIEKDKYDKSA